MRTSRERDTAMAAARLAQLTARLRAEPDVQHTARAVVAGARDLLPGVTDISITQRARRRRFATLEATSEIVREADAAQYALLEGPCVETAEAADWSRSGNLASDRRWPGWGPRAAAMGFASVLSVALSTEDHRFGALNLYSRAAGDFVTTDGVEVAQLFAMHAAQALGSSRRIGNLEIAMSSRHDIGVAQGRIMERYGLTLPQSFELLRRISSQSNVKLSEVARQVAETGEVPPLAG